MRIALIQIDPSPRGGSDIPFSHYNQAEPLGLLSLASALEQGNHEVILIHPNVDHPNPFSSHRALRSIRRFRPDILAVSCMTRQVPAARAFVADARLIVPESLTVVGGDHFSATPHDLALFPEFDVAVSGEGEVALQWIIDHRREQWEIHTVPTGVYWRNGNRIEGHGVASRIGKLDALPPPKRLYSLLASSYVGTLMYPPRSQQTGMASVYASRGCPYSCSYCDAAQVWGKRIVERSPEQVVDELREVIRQHGVNTAFFVDLTFNVNRRRLLELCATLEQAQLELSWYVLLRPGAPNSPLHVDRQVLEALKRAGCMKVGFGVETISPEISKDLNRLKGNGHLIEATRIMDELGILSKAFFIIGHPAENSDYHHQLVEYLNQLCADEIRMSFLTPFPGTPLWHQYKDQLPRPENYEAYSTFEPLISHPVFSVEELHRIRLTILSQYYSGKSYREHVIAKVQAHPNLGKAFHEFSEYTEEEVLRADNFIRSRAVSTGQSEKLSP